MSEFMRVPPLPPSTRAVLKWVTEQLEASAEDLRQGRVEENAKGFPDEMRRFYAALCAERDGPARDSDMGDPKPK